MTAVFDFRLPGHSGPHWGCSQTVWASWKSAMLWELVSEAELRPIYPPSPKKQQGKKDDVKRWGNNKRIYYRPNSCHKSLTIHWGEVVHLLCSLRLEKKNIVRSGRTNHFNDLLINARVFSSSGTHLWTVTRCISCLCWLLLLLGLLLFFFLLRFLLFLLFALPRTILKGCFIYFIFLLVSFCYKSNCSRR